MNDLTIDTLTSDVIDAIDGALARLEPREWTFTSDGWKADPAWHLFTAIDTLTSI